MAEGVGKFKFKKLKNSKMARRQPSCKMVDGATLSVSKVI
jgi:hypothetical protein